MSLKQKYLGTFVLYLSVAVALVSVSGTNETWAATDQMESVLYFKNGNVIRGVIVEQVLGESLKIQTREGSILKFQVDEIEKITTVKTGSRKSPGKALAISLGAGILIDGLGQRYNGEPLKGVGFGLWSWLSTGLIVADDGPPIAVGYLSRLAAARDAYTSAKRINAERGYANLSEKDIPKRPTINLGMRGRDNIYLALNHRF